MGLTSNPLLAGMILLVVILQMAVIYIPAFNHFFEVVSLNLIDLSVAVGAGIVVFTMMEILKVAKDE
jgi:P-type Ca2+ transporter type 2C